MARPLRRSGRHAVENARRPRRNVSYLEDSDDELENGQSDEEPKEEPENEPIKDEDLDEDDEIEPASPPSDNDNDKEDNNYDDAYSDEDEEVLPLRKRRRAPPRDKKGLDDEEFRDDAQLASEADDSDGAFDEDDAYLEKLREKQFVALDDDDAGGNSFYSYKRPRKHKSRSRSVERHKRKFSVGGDDDEANEDDSIQQEINELYDSSPDESPVKHKLREREKINYTIPPPITNDNMSELYAAAPLSQPFRARGRKNNKSDFRKLLFPTAGPFGGSDVLSVLGQNIPPGGIPIPGMTAEMGPSMALGNDLDSSDDEIAPTATELYGLPQAKPVPMLNNTLNHTKIIGAQSVADGKKKSSLSDTDPLGVDMNIDFSSVGGLDGYIDQLKEMVALPLLYPELYQNFSITPPRGVLFHGPPGTGKTLMARALAASCSTPSRKITFFMRKGADCLSKWVGEAERQLRLLFEEAKNQQPSIIFFDEIDGLAPVRSSKQEQIHASIVSTLLALMDGMDNRGQVIVIGATNRPDSVDPALRRPGRFDREFYFGLPDISARKQILKIHTKKWVPPLAPEFIDKVAGLTKGYGGADLRALCTEAALNSIQRKYPQIYQSNDKLIVNPKKVKVVAKDFMRAIDKIVPSSARSASTSSSPLSERLQPLLQDSLDKIVHKLNDLLPDSVGIGGKKKLLNLEEALYLDPTLKDADGGFSKHELLKTLESSRICKPHLLICGERGSGQQYIGAAILNLLEGFQVQNLDLATMFGDVTRTPELCIVQTFIEARRHQPSIIFIPNIDTWFDVMTHSAKATLSGLLRNLRSNEKILLLGIAERPYEELDTEIKMTLGFLGELNNFTLTNPTQEARKKFFVAVENALMMKPYEFLNDLENRPKRKLKQLKVLPQDKPGEGDLTKKQVKQQEYEDKKLKNLLKIKLAGLMDLFKNRYKRFKKPIIDDAFLHHLFEPSVLENPMMPYEVAYIVAKDAEHQNMIQELATGKYFHNMDLDTIEERIWNGFYSEAKQFLKDVKMIVRDSITSGDRERILKANEMLTNAQFGIDDFNNAEFAKACKEMRAREVERQAKLLEDHKKLQEEFAKKQQTNLEQLDPTMLNGHSETPVVEVLMDTKPEDEDQDDNGESKEEENGKATQDVEKIEISDEDESEKEDSDKDDLDEESDKKDSDVEMEDAEEDVEEEEKEKKEDSAVKPNGDALPNGSTEPSKQNGTVSETLVNGVAEISKIPETLPETTPESSDSESEAENEPLHDTSRELVIPPHTKDLFETDMVQATELFTVEKLEYFVALLMEIIWADRAQWDKTATVAKLQEVLRHLDV